MIEQIEDLQHHAAMLGSTITSLSANLDELGGFGREPIELNHILPQGVGLGNDVDQWIRMTPRLMRLTQTSGFKRPSSSVEEGSREHKRRAESTTNSSR